MSDFRTALIEDSRIADITSTEAFGVQSGAAQSTYQQFQAVSASNSSLVFNVQIPSENIVIDRHLLIQSQVAIELTIPTGVVPTNDVAFAYGLTDSFQAFPLNSLFTTVQTTINNVSVSTNLKDILPMITRMNDKRELSRWNSTTPSYCDNIYGMYRDALNNGTVPFAPPAAAIPLSNSNNPMAATNTNGYDEDFFPRGSFKLDFLQIDRYVAGVYTDASPICTAIATNSWKIFIKATFTEPFLALSPFVNTDPENSAGLVGVNNLSLVCNIDSSCARVFSTALSTVGPAALTPYANIALGWADVPNGGASQPVGFQNSRLLFNFLSLQPEQYAKISTKNVVPFLDYPRYLTTSTNATPLAIGASSVITSQSIQLNQVPDLILICARVPMSAQNIAYTSSFLEINGIQINFNNASGLLATATQQDLYNLSVRNGSTQSWHEFAGVTQRSNWSTYALQNIPSTGSLLVLNPVLDFSLPSYLSSSSLGQYQFQFNLTVTNNYPFAVTPELCIITMNSGIFVTQQGTSQIFTGILTKEQVLNTKEKNPVPHLSTNEYKRLVGGKLSNRGMGSLMKMVRDMPKLHHHLMAKVEGAGSSGGGSSGGLAGGSISKGGKSSSKLAKHFA